MKRMLPGAPSGNRKRYSKQVQSSTEFLATSSAQSAVNLEILSDSHAAFEAIVREVSAISGFPLAIPGCFIHQIYAIVKNKTRVNHDLQEARTSGSLRHIHVEQCGILLVRESDYRSLVNALIDSARQDAAASFELSVLERFLMVLQEYREMGITQKRLSELMGPVVDERRTMVSLLRLGFVVFQTQGADVEQEPALWFALPNMRVLIKEVLDARKELVSLIKSAKPYRELLRSKLFARGKLKSSSMSIEFHVKDAIGAGIIVARDTALEGAESLFLLPDKLTA